MRTFRYTALGLALVATACAKAENAPDTTAMSAVPAMDAGPAPISLAQIAGTWQMVSRPTSGSDTVSTPSTLTATADTTGWMLGFAGRPPVKVHVRIDADSIMITSDTYESVRRKGVKVFTTGVHRLQEGKLVGMTTAHYSTKAADSVLVLSSESTKVP